MNVCDVILKHKKTFDGHSQIELNGKFKISEVMQLVEDLEKALAASGETQNLCHLKLFSDGSAGIYRFSSDGSKLLLSVEVVVY